MRILKNFKICDKVDRFPSAWNGREIFYGIEDHGIPDCPHERAKARIGQVFNAQLKDDGIYGDLHLTKNWPMGELKAVYGNENGSIIPLCLVATVGDTRPSAILNNETNDAPPLFLNEKETEIYGVPEAPRILSRYGKIRSNDISVPEMPRIVTEDADYV